MGDRESDNALPLLLLTVRDNIFTALFVVALVFKLYGTMAEMGDPSDFGDEIPLLIAFVLTIANRFVYGKIAQLKILIGLLVMTRNLPGTRFLWTSDRCSLMLFVAR